MAAQAARLNGTPDSDAVDTPDKPFNSSICRRSALLSLVSDQASSLTCRRQTHKPNQFFVRRSGVSE